MQVKSFRLPRRAAAVLCVVAAALSGFAAVGAAEFMETKTFSGRSLTVENLIGEVRISGHSGSGYEVVVHVRGRDATDAVKINTESDRLSIVFPKEKRFAYPALGSGSTTFTPTRNGSQSWLRSLLGGDRIEVSGKGNGIEVWADIEVRIPRGGDFKLYHAVGEISAEGVHGNVVLDSHSSKVKVHEIDGDVWVDTGSGSVSISGVRGKIVRVDTGSGGVEANDIVASESIGIDTGSGSVKIDGLNTGSLVVDTGSGGVRAVAVQTDAAEIDTGSGSVSLELARMGGGRFSIDTGSGSITLAVPHDAAFSAEADTGSGGIDIALDSDVDMRRKDSDEAIFTVRGGGAQVVLDSGSGRIRVEHSR